MTPAYRRVQAARTTLLLDQPFFGVLALGLKLIEDAACPTAYTNGRDLGFNPSFVTTLTDDQLTALIAHEVMHCACGHPWRRGSRDHDRFNVAADHAINHVLRDAGFQLPPDALEDPQYKGKWAEWIYDRLPPPSPSQSPSGSQPGAGNGQAGEVLDAPTDADAPTEADWQQSTQQSARAAQARGKLPASLRSEIDTLTRGRADWRSLLRRFMQAISQSDYTWSRPNVRYIPSGLYLPSLRSAAFGKLAIAVDTSGSIDIVLLSQFAAEVQAIAQELQPESIEVLYCDSRVHRVDTFARGEAVTIDAVGRGGTSFVPVFDHIATEDVPPAVLIYLTDLDGEFPSSAPEYPVIWAAYGTQSIAPFGETIPCE